jgi:hypothetical protein
MRLIALTVATATLILMSPAEATSPTLTLEDRISVMPKEQALDLAIPAIR